MQSKILIIALVTFVFSSNVLQAQKANEKITLSTGKKYSAYFEGDSLLGTGKEISLKKGMYKIRIVRNLYEWNSPSIVKNIFAKTDKSIFNLTFPKERVIDSQPQDAAVLVKDSVLGYTPLLLSNVKFNKIEVRKEGYKSKYYELPLSSEVILPKMPVVGKKNFINSKWFNVLVASSVAFGAVAAYFKLKADSKYDEYLSTRDKSLIGKIKLLDNISGVSVSLLEINFGFLIYYFLAE